MKRISIRIAVILGLIFILFKGVEWLIEYNFEITLNSFPERSYNLTYSDIDLSTFFKGITLEGLRIEPIDSTTGLKVYGNVDYATISGLAWWDLLVSKKLTLREIAFDNPHFELTLKEDSIKVSTGKGIQNLFGDILSRAKVKHFSLKDGSIDLIDEASDQIRASLLNLNIEARNIITDSLHMKHIIPFEMEDLKVSLDSLDVHLNDYTNFRINRFDYNLNKKKVTLSDIYLGYKIDWVEVSQRLGFQTDIIELSLKELAIHEFEPSNDFYTNLDLVAKKLTLDSLTLHLKRNKNIQRPPNAKMPMFNGIIDSMPVAFKLDSILIKNSSLSYSELGLKKNESGTVAISEINGTITQLTNFPEYQNEWKALGANLDSKIGPNTPIHLNLSMPYRKPAFSLNVIVGQMNLMEMNSAVIPLAGVKINSGQMHNLRFSMDAGAYISRNKLIFNYKDLHVDVLKENSNHQKKKRGFISLIANSVVRSNNMPSEKRYLTADYQSSRNIYRSPLNYIIQGLIHGLTEIIPSKGAQLFIQ